MWRDGNLEVDFVVTCEDAVCAIEVRGGRVKPTRGMFEFIVGNPNARALVVGSRECLLEDFPLRANRLVLMMQDADS